MMNKMNKKVVRSHTLKPQDKTILHFRYRMHMDYEIPVEKYFFTIKAIPCRNARQTVLDLSMHLQPPFLYSDNRDAFGNQLIYGSARQSHRSFSYEIRGRVEIGQILYEEVARGEEAYLYRHPHGLNRAGNELKGYYDSIAGQLEENSYVNAIYLMRCLHRDFVYAADVTRVDTDAEAAWRIGRGVCQDYAHIFIALCHMAGIAARYVVGIMQGEGESHAWVEILYRGKWIGMDPTNDQLVARSHIKFGHGRDARDCQLNRGILYGGGAQLQEIKVSVSEE